MQNWQRIVIGAFVACGLWSLTGCEDEKRKVTVKETQHEGEVVEEQPGEMIVE